ncbi:hypothetical protein SAMN04490248_11884 [Salinihabitans flavidus]|uniref:Uncharacterized protein n=1 Tax=Salinihabitans flavidus TaxID=569882 RepID=A0A1H8U7H9_9RHOB|nr:hypothetical protein [Salinihabitans flavidus]SEO99230.1 hypothetical protein SAMN04490248_11884 [Salinihabitans flavidus]
MVAVSDFMDDVHPVSADPAEQIGPSTLLRISALVLGFAFILAGIGLWMVPGPVLAGGTLMAKALVSILLTAAGVGMAQIGTDKPVRELHFDARHRQVYLVDAIGRRTKVLRVVDYEDIFRIEITDDRLFLRDRDDKELAGMELHGAAARRDAEAQLRAQSLIFA